MGEKIADIYYEVGYQMNDKEIKKVEKANEQLGQKADKAGEKLETLGKKVKKTGNTAKQTKPDIDELGKSIGKAGDDAQNSGDKIGNYLSGIGQKIAGVISAGVVFNQMKDYVISSVNAYADLDDSLRKTGAKIQATDEQMVSLRESTREVALQFHTTAKEVSDAQEYLALAGYSLKEIQDASPTVIAAQKATGESMQLVSDIATDTASSYGYMADELNYVTDRMVYTTNKFNTNFAQLGEAMKYVAPIANQTGMEFSDLNSYLGVLANSGIKGSQAGTALRQTFLRLQAPTGIASKLLREYKVDLFNTKGEFIGVNESMLKIEKATKKMTEQQKAFFLQQLFGTEAMSSINILFKEGIENVVEYGKAIESSTGTTKQMAMYMEEGLGGMKRAFEGEKSALQSLMGEIFDPIAYRFLFILTEGMEGVRENIEGEKSKWQKIVAGAGAYIGEGLGFAGNAIVKGLSVTDKALTGGLSSKMYNSLENILTEKGEEVLGINEKEKEKNRAIVEAAIAYDNDKSLNKIEYAMGNDFYKPIYKPQELDTIFSTGKDYRSNSSKLTLEFDFKNLNGIFDKEEYRQGIQELTLKTLEKQFGKVRNSY